MTAAPTTPSVSGGAPGWLGWAREHSVAVLSVVLTVWLVIVPLATLIIFSFRLGNPWEPGGFTLEHYASAYSDPQTWSMFFNTALLAVFSTAISVGLATFFAFLTERTDMPFRNVAWGLILVPMAMPGLLFAVSWTFLLSPQIGLFNVWMRGVAGWFGVELTSGPLNIYSLWGMVLLEGLRGVTTTFLIMVGAFRAMDPSLEEAARVAGASGRRTFFGIFLPLLTPAILGATMYSFMTHLESLEVPLVIGLPARIHVFPTYIFYTTQRYTPPEYGLSAALGASFLLVSILLVYAYRYAMRQEGRFATITGKGYRPRVMALGNWRYVAFAVFFLYFTLTIAAPAFVLLWSSLLPVYMTPSWEMFSDLNLEHYREIFSDGDVWDATVNTIVIALGAATLTMLLSLVVAWVILRKRFRGRTLLDAVTFLPHALPGRDHRHRVHVPVPPAAVQRAAPLRDGVDHRAGTHRELHRLRQPQHGRGPDPGPRGIGGGQPRIRRKMAHAHAADRAAAGIARVHRRLDLGGVSFPAQLLRAADPGHPRELDAVRHHVALVGKTAIRGRPPPWECCSSSRWRC